MCEYSNDYTKLVKRYAINLVYFHIFEQPRVLWINQELLPTVDTFSIISVIDLIDNIYVQSQSGVISVISFLKNKIWISVPQKLNIPNEYIQNLRLTRHRLAFRKKNLTATLTVYNIRFRTTF